MFVPHHELVSANDAAPARWMLVLHGIYGSGANWRGLARKLVARQPDWGVALCDLRLHGRSRAAPPPHTVAAAAADLACLTENLAHEGRPVRALCGHSFGGKVALVYRGHAGAELLHTFLVDSPPGAQPGALHQPDNLVARVLHMLEGLPASFASRDEFIAHAGQHGLARPIAQWLAMSLHGQDGAYVSHFDASALGELLRDFYQLDSWRNVESGPGMLHAVLAGQSSAVSASERARLAALADTHADIDLTVIERSGHWVHIDAPGPLLEVIATGLTRQGGSA